MEKKAKGHIRNKGRKHSIESINKMKQSAIGNSKKSGYIMSEESKKNIGNKNRKPKPIGFGSNRHTKIYQYDLEGNFIKEWDGINKTKKLFKGDIASCCSGRQKTAGGFIWKYKE